MARKIPLSCTTPPLSPQLSDRDKINLSAWHIIVPSLLVVLFSLPASGAYVLHSACIGYSGGQLGGTGHTLRCMAGQPIAGDTRGPSNIVEIGFWLEHAAAVTMAEPLPVERFFLGDNQPNPFNPVTWLRYSLPSPGRVSLCVHDLRGRLVQRLVHGEQSVGEHRVVWDGRDDRGVPAASGAYIARLRTCHGTLTKKLMLAR